MHDKLIEDQKRRILAFPEDWWKGQAASSSFANLFSRHLLALHMVFKHRGKIYQDFYTGFALYHRQRLMWVTAGHVVDEILDRAFDPDFEIGAAGWLDGCDISGAESIPAGDLKDSVAFSATQLGIDFGVISLDLVAMTLTKSPSLKFLTEEVWLNHELSKPEGYYVVGFPAQWWKTNTRKMSPKQTFAGIRATIACIPFERIQPEESVCPGDFWDHPTAIYGNVLFPQGASKDEQLSHLRGTSGGPIFSIERTSAGELKYRLFGVQSACSEDRPILRAESFGDILEIMAPVVGINPITE